MKYQLTKTQTQYLLRNPAKQWTSPIDGEVTDQYHVEVDGVDYWLDLAEDGEVASIHDAVLFWNGDIFADSDMRDSLDEEEYDELFLDISAAIDRNILLDGSIREHFARLDEELGVQQEVTVDNLQAFVTKLNTQFLERK